MTANKDLKKLIRSRMRKTGESYTPARRYFLWPGKVTMAERDKQQGVIEVLEVLASRGL